MAPTPSVPNIGILVFDKAPRAYLPPSRLRALLAEAVLQGASLTLFSAAGCDLATGTISGESWFDRGWQPVEVRLPDIVLIVTTPIRRHHFSVERWIRASTPVVKDVGVGKLGLARLLEKSHLASHVIPYSVLEGNATDLILEWLRKEEHIVVKPVDGKRGSNIYVLHRTENGWEVHKDGQRHRFGSAEEAASYAERRIAGRMRYRDFIVQKYVASHTPDGRTVDFRVHAQRDGNGRWSITRAYARLGELGMAVSNVSRGAYQGPVEGHLTGRSLSIEELSKEIELLSFGIVELVDAATRRPLSELGIDLTIDRDDHFWIIEANARPQSSRHEHERAINTIAYALHLHAAQHHRKAAS